jgi:hypothetical protein
MLDNCRRLAADDARAAQRRPYPLAPASAEARGPTAETAVAALLAMSDGASDRAGLHKESVEAASGFEPLNGGFADLSLNHLGTPPLRVRS